MLIMDKLFIGDALNVLKSLPGKSVQTCITSPPYYGLRDYGVKGQIGLEETPEAYIKNIVEIFRGVRRALRDDGTLWLNIDDTCKGIPLNIPWRVAFALVGDGWLLQSDIVWHKTNAMPRNAKRRPSRDHEYLFLLSKTARYHYDAEEVLVPYTKPLNRYGGAKKKISDSLKEGSAYSSAHRERKMRPNPDGRHRRTVWGIPTFSFPGAHNAPFPPGLVETCILAGAPMGSVVLDPFLGSGTTAAVAKRLGRRFVGIELNPAYVELAKERLATVQLGRAA
jgi:DNA modification methylase